MTKDRHIHFSDHLETKIAYALLDERIEFTHESENKGQVLDFYLPKFDLYIEVKQFHSERISKQMESQKNVIAIQGVQSVDFFINLIKGFAQKK